VARLSARYLGKRLLASVLVIWVILTLLFILLKMLPGDVSTAFVSPKLSASDQHQLRARYGVDEPLWSQYFHWLSSYLQLQFGYSMTAPEPVLDIVLRRLPRTLVLFGTAFLFQFSLGPIAGIHLGWNRGSRVDYTGFLGSIILYSIPFFWIGWLGLLVFSSPSIGVSLVPGGQMTTPFQTRFGAFELLLDVGWHLLLPAASLVAVGVAGPLLVTRTAMQEVIDRPYIHVARAKGLPPAVVKYKHAGRNALIPVATQSLVAVAFLLDGSVVVETVFSWPGMGELLVSAILARNMPVAFASFFVLGVLIVVLRLLLDVVYTLLDPEITFGETA